MALKLFSNFQSLFMKAYKKGSLKRTTVQEKFLESQNKFLNYKIFYQSRVDNYFFAYNFKFKTF